MARKKVYEDDDGRTIADMTGVAGPGLFSRSSEKKQNREPEIQASSHLGVDTGYSWKERLMVVLGVMKATMLIALCYILGFGLLILLLCYFA